MSQNIPLSSQQQSFTPNLGGIVNGYFTPIPPSLQKDGYVVVADPNQTPPKANDVKEVKLDKVPRLLKPGAGGSKTIKPVRLHLRGAYGSISTDATGWLGASIVMNDVQTALDFSTFKTMFDTYKIHGMYIHMASIGPYVTNHQPLASAFDVDNYGSSNLSLGDIRSTILRYTTDSKQIGVRFHHTADKSFSRTFRFPIGKKSYETDGIIGASNTMLIKPGKYVNIDNGNNVNVGTLYVGTLAVGPTSAPLLQYTIYYDVEFSNRS